MTAADVIVAVPAPFKNCDNAEDSSTVPDIVAEVSEIADVGICNRLVSLPDAPRNEYTVDTEPV